jgi:lysozyme
VAALVAAIGAVAAALVLVVVPRHEGTVLGGYWDALGRVVTACTGHTETAVLGRRYTAAECEELLASDLVKHNRALERCIPGPLAPHVKAAFLSLHFNVGHGKAGTKDGVCVLKSGRPSTLSVLANRGDIAGACAEISKWTGVRGRDCSIAANRCGGIVRRRADERALCEGKYPGGPNDPANAAPSGGAQV